MEIDAKDVELINESVHGEDFGASLRDYFAERLNSLADALEEQGKEIQAVKAELERMQS